MDRRSRSTSTAPCSSGLLSHVGRRAADGREYEGARGLRFTPARDSALAAAPPPWAMVAELVHTTRLWGREGAPIKPRWAIELGEHLLAREYGEPAWDPDRAEVTAGERVSLYGLTLSDMARIPYDRVDRPRARELFLRHALVRGEWAARHAFLDDNRRLCEEVRALEDRARRRDILVDDETLLRFYDERVPAQVASGSQFDLWWREAQRGDPRQLHFTRELLVRAGAPAPTEGERPETWVQNDLELALTYRFEPGREDDGVTVHVPLARLNALSPDGFEWLVPGLRAELLTALIRALPKDLRRALVPVPELVAELLVRLRPGREPLLPALGHEVEQLRGVRVPLAAWDRDRLPAHLRVSFEVDDDDGAPLARGADLSDLRRELAPALRERLATASADLRRHGLRGWDLQTLPRQISLPGSEGSVLGYPALVDEGDAVGVAVLDGPAAQEAAMRLGTRRLLTLTVPSPRRGLTDGLDGSSRLALAAAPHANVDAVLDDVVAAALDALVREAGGPAWDAPSFARLHDRVAAELPAAVAGVLAALLRILRARGDLQEAMDALVAPALQPARLDVATQLGGLVFAGFLTAAGAERLADVERYLLAAQRRLARLPAAVARDRDRMESVHELERRYRLLRERRPPAEPLPESMRELPWLLQELRVHCFAEGLARGAPVSAAARSARAGRGRRSFDDRCPPIMRRPSSTSAGSTTIAVIARNHAWPASVPSPRECTIPSSQATAVKRCRARQRWGPIRPRGSRTGRARSCPTPR